MGETEMVDNNAIINKGETEMVDNNAIINKGETEMVDNNAIINKGETEMVDNNQIIAVRKKFNIKLDEMGDEIDNIDNEYRYMMVEHPNEYFSELDDAYDKAILKANLKYLKQKNVSPSPNDKGDNLELFLKSLENIELSYNRHVYDYIEAAKEDELADELLDQYDGSVKIQTKAAKAVEKAMRQYLKEEKNRIKEERAIAKLNRINARNAKLLNEINAIKGTR